MRACSVDDLEDISQLEVYVKASQTVLIFLSKGYFFSANCLRQLDCARSHSKPLILVHEPDMGHGGAPLDILRTDCTSRGQGREDIFWQGQGDDRVGRPIIPWQRLSEFQTTVLTLIAARVLHACPAYRKLDEPPALHVPGSITTRKLCFQARVELYVSSHNPGADAMAKELSRYCQRKVSAQDIGGLTIRLGKNHEAAQDDLYISEHSASRDFSESMSAGTFHVRTVGRRPTSHLLRRARAKLGPAQNLIAESEETEATHMLVYLNQNTFIGEDGHVLADELRLARSRMPIVLVHEVDHERGGCAFEHLFQTTPEDLVSGGLYTKVALACQAAPLRDVSLALVAKAIGAVPAPSNLKRMVSTSRAALESSTSSQQFSSASPSASKGLSARTLHFPSLFSHSSVSENVSTVAADEAEVPPSSTAGSRTSELAVGASTGEGFGSGASNYGTPSGNPSDMVPGANESTAANTVTAAAPSDQVAVSIADDKQSQTPTIERVRSVQTSSLTWLATEEGRAAAGGSMSTRATSPDTCMSEEPKPDGELAI